jgi:hypothetical protein
LNESHRALIDYLSELGAEAVQLEPGGKHPRLAFA